MQKFGSLRDFTGKYCDQKVGPHSEERDAELRESLKGFLVRHRKE